MNSPSVIRRLSRRLRSGGLRWLLSALVSRVAPARPAMRAAVVALVREKTGLEIGGPSRVFARGQLLPVYPVAARIDNVNFSTQTTWEEGLRDGGEFRFDPNRAPGRQWIRDAVALTGVIDASYDFILSSHCLEHVANPLCALQEWHRVTRAGGHLVLILPDPQHTFDHRRPVTTLDHLREDRTGNRAESDATHVPEVLALHDLDRDPWAGSAENFRERVSRNAENRCIHHHVFNLSLITAMLADVGWHVLATEKARPLHLIALAEKIGR